jgi:hypothetical protein
MIVRTMPSRHEAIAMASRALAAGKINSRDAQTVERCVQGSGIIPADVLHRVKQGSR